MSVNKTVALTRKPRVEPVCLRLSEIATLVGGDPAGSDDPLVSGVAGIEDAGPGDLTFLAHGRYRKKLRDTRASAVLVRRDEPVDIPAVRVDDPALAFTIVLRKFADAGKPLCARAIHPTAVIDDSVRLGVDVAIGANVVLEEGVEVGDRSTILPGTVILRDARVGADCLIYPNVTIREDVRLGDRVIVHPGAVLGGDGFGYVPNGRLLHKIPHVGTVEIGDDVEIGANACIDRATTGVTRIGRGTKIDNLVQIAHNVKIGESSVLCAQVGVSGSTEIGNGVTLAGQVGLVGHIRIGDQVMVGAQSGVSKSIAPKHKVSGYPATEHATELRQRAALSRLPGMLETVRDLRRRLDALEAQGDSGDRKSDDPRA